MKNIYEVPELEISLFLKNDVLTASNDNIFNDPWNTEPVEEVIGGNIGL